jgi:hypothetical protein
VYLLPSNFGGALFPRVGCRSLIFGVACGRSFDASGLLGFVYCAIPVTIFNVFFIIFCIYISMCIKCVNAGYSSFFE